MKNLIVRALTGAVYVILLVGCTVYSPVTFFFFFSLVSAAAVWEFSSLMNRHQGAFIPAPINSMSAVVLAAGVWLQCMGAPTAMQMMALYGLLMLYMLISQLYRRTSNPLREWTMVFASQMYVAVPFALMPLLCISNDATGDSLAYNWIYPLALFVFIWTNDTGAYLSGFALHKFFPAKLFPSISPKKTWVGSIGGALFTVLASVAVYYWMPGTMPLYRWIGFALVVVLFGTWGDLVESQLKRQLGIKDSGKILPGHGGMLDRFDSSLLAIPASVIYLVFSA